MNPRPVSDTAHRVMFSSSSYNYPLTLSLHQTRKHHPSWWTYINIDSCHMLMGFSHICLKYVNTKHIEVDLNLKNKVVEERWCQFLYITLNPFFLFWLLFPLWCLVRCLVAQVPLHRSHLWNDKQCFAQTNKTRHILISRTAHLAREKPLLPTRSLFFEEPFDQGMLLQGINERVC